MRKGLVTIGRLAGIAGVALSVIAVVLRAMGQRKLPGMVEVGTLLQAGIAGMVLAVLCYVAILGERLD